ncbi:DUF11 domain-containing protein [Sphingomonas bacterium]|uniref:DUF11 domain-containing protein n=1 Tax=Sphingomonas bacterium TaxID=1895847 RepID=UPI001576E764|nr:DUF11 domain-containing protein [Sphingomonas bacterium]
MTRTMTRLLLASTALVCGAGVAHAQSGTVAGTTITNTAQASYTVNGTAQTASSNTAIFVVDRKVNLTNVTEQAANTQVNLGQTGAVATFRVTNNTNGTQDFVLAAEQNVAGGGQLGTDNFDVTNLRVFVDANGNGVYDPGVDTLNYIDELAPDTSRVVFLVADIPSAAGANLAVVSLNAIAAAGGVVGTQGLPLVPTDLSVLNQDATIDVVFADNDSDGIGPDIARNGQARAYAAFEVGTRNVALSVVKSSRVVSDGVNALNPKALPGAVVEYCLTVANATLLTAANNVTLTDVMPANTTYVPGSITVGALGAAGVCVTGGYAQADDGSNTTGPYRGSYTAASKTVTATIPLLAGGTSLAAAFRVTIN